ncbi:hypothetical protein D623_10008840 [Myotis brandtii]|uniref:Uncharacterized protein n=1 Tax=Myotis brandtii TaxID=109478 RepID=S7NSL9_MYOBR|nr:hypothetical protein D623_10008840 [Myotis brandtii]
MAAPEPRGQESENEGAVQRDVTRGEGGTEHLWLAPLGAQRPAGLCPLLSGGAHTTPASGPQNPQDDKKWCYPAHAWASDPGLLQVLLALTQEYAALGTTNHPSQESAAKVEQRTEIGDTSTTDASSSRGSTCPRSGRSAHREHLALHCAPSCLCPSSPGLTRSLASSINPFQHLVFACPPCAVAVGGGT